MKGVRSPKLTSGFHLLCRTEGPGPPGYSWSLASPEHQLKLPRWSLRQCAATNCHTVCRYGKTPSMLGLCLSSDLLTHLSATQSYVTSSKGKYRLILVTAVRPPCNCMTTSREIHNSDRASATSTHSAGSSKAVQRHS